MDKTAEDLIRLTRLIRLNFQLLRTLGDEMHADLGLNTSLRAVMEAASENGKRTVPQIAAAKSVSRQHIQKHADMLVASGHVLLAVNPGHKRSPFVTLTEKGAAVFAEMKRREARFVHSIVQDTDFAKLPEAVGQLELLAVALRGAISGKQ